MARSTSVFENTRGVMRSADLSWIGRQPLKRPPFPPEKRSDGGYPLIVGHAARDVIEQILIVRMVRAEHPVPERKVEPEIVAEGTMVDVVMCRSQNPLADRMAREAFREKLEPQMGQ